MTQLLSRPEKVPSKVRSSAPHSQTPLEGEGPIKHLFTVEQYQRMWDEGILDPSKRYELIEGEILEMTQNPPHRFALAFLNTLLGERLAGRVLISPQAPIDLPSDLTKPEPDIMVIPLERLKKAHFEPEHLAFLIEVSDSTVRFDQTRKLVLYARAGVQEYWILNLNSRTLEQYRNPFEGGYKSKITLEPGEPANSLTYPDLALEWWKALFDETEETPSSTIQDTPEGAQD